MQRGWSLFRFCWNFLLWTLQANLLYCSSCRIQRDEQLISPHKNFIPPLVAVWHPITRCPTTPVLSLCLSVTLHINMNIIQTLKSHINIFSFMLHSLYAIIHQQDLSSAQSHECHYSLWFKYDLFNSITQEYIFVTFPFHVFVFASHNILNITSVIKSCMSNTQMPMTHHSHNNAPGRWVR